jgi:hypothetical protein
MGEIQDTSEEQPAGECTGCEAADGETVGETGHA